MAQNFNRRDLLKLTKTTIGGSVLAGFLPQLPPFSVFLDNELIRITSSGLEGKGIPIYSKPTDESTIVRMAYRDDLLNLYDEVDSGTPDYNPVWYRVWGGYVNRARTQKVSPVLNAISSSIRENGQLAEVTVPYTQAVRKVIDKWEPMNRLYYSSVHWVVGVDPGPDGAPWYLVLDELLDLTYHVPASHLRLIPDIEIEPASPAVPFEGKFIQVNLTSQRVICFEYGKEVFNTIISSGRLDTTPGPNGIPTATPLGKFHITVKMPSKHMGSGDLASASDIEAYQLPGVPWVSFMQYENRKFQGHAFHGTFWHHNFGVPMSSGCINMLSDEAKWLFRWCYPTAGAPELDPLTLDKKGYGTPGEVIN
jgi:lipoprotein-anchoring transpeptidase ErfK/SrfK